MSGSTWLVNGEAVANATELDRGLQFGDGLFETMLARGGEVPWLDRHMERLAKACEVLDIPCPERARIESDLTRLDLPEGPAVVKLMVTAGPGGRGYARPGQVRPTRHLAVFPFPERPERLSLVWCRQRLALQPALAGLKHLNRLEQVLARREVDAMGADEGLMRDTMDRVVEAVAANLFVVRSGRLETPSLEQCGVAGLMREAVLETARNLGIDAQITDISAEDILSADEVFLTNSLMGIRPVKELKDTTGSLPSVEWDREAGLVTRELQQASCWPLGEY